MTNTLTRRELIQKTLAGFGAVSLPISLTACGDDSDDSSGSGVSVQFEHGVASGDPLQDRVIIWTRATPSDVQARLEIVWEVALDAQFTQIKTSGKVQTSPAQDFTVKVDVTGLHAQQRYFYRFRFGQTVSPIGQTKTLPLQTNQVKLAVCSCSNYPAGYFYVYREMAKQDIDVVLHLGDYIYEYGQNGYATEDSEKLGRLLAADNQQEVLSL
jgi:alkaline phosphatase D